MTLDEQVEAFLKYCEEHKIELPNPEHYPIQVSYQIKLWRYCTNTKPA